MYLTSIVNIRNFSIIAHIDHGKSTLADRFVKQAHAAPGRLADAQLFDTMELERERGVTIKLKPVRFQHRGVQLNLIDTPGHVDFSYEVSRALAAVEGALLVVDASQGVQAQTLAHLTVARSLGLTIVPVINKIDLPNAQTASVAAELTDLLQCTPSDILRVSAKTGDGVAALLDALVHRIPPPAGNADGNPQALIFDAVFDEYRGVIAYVRVVQGTLRRGDHLSFLGTKAAGELLDVGSFAPVAAGTPVANQQSLAAGEIGALVTGLKSINACRVGDTVTRMGAAAAPLPGYREPQPMVYASLYPDDGGDVALLRKALEKLRLNDASLQFEGERSSALGLGFRCGFLGLFHLEIVQERLRREYHQEPVVTVPSVAYRIRRTDGTSQIVRTAQDLPDPTQLAEVREPWVRLRCILPPPFLGSVMQLVQERRGGVESTEYLGAGTALERVVVQSAVPLSALLTDFYDTLKSRTSGFASMYYALLDERPAAIVRLDILIAGERADALSSLVVRDEAPRRGRSILLALKETLPRAQFEIRLQAALGGTIIAAERIPPLRKDVTAKLYGGDVTRKRKLLEKQKKGKQRMRSQGRVAVPPNAYLAVLKRDASSGSVQER